MKRGAITLCVALAWAGAAAPAAGQSYPVRPIRFILPFPAGGPTDILGRAVGQKLTEQLGQPVVPENRPGVGGNLGAEVAAKSPPDGYTIVLCAPSLAISPHLYKKMGYDPVKDLAPITLVANIPNVLLVHPSVPAHSVKELVALARQRPGKLTFGSGGVGTSNHLGGEMLKGLAGINMLHVPYKGSNQAMLAMMGGHVDMVVIGAPAALPQIQAGKVRVLAVLAPERYRLLPDVPTAAQAGYPGYEVITWYGVLGPAGMAREALTRINGEWTKLMHSAEGRERIISAGFEPMASTPEAFGEFIRSEMVRWGKVIQASGFHPE